MSSEKILMQNFVFTVLFGHYLDPPIHFHFHPTLGLDPALILALRPYYHVKIIEFFWQDYLLHEHHNANTHCITQHLIIAIGRTAFCFHLTVRSTQVRSDLTM